MAKKIQLINELCNATDSLGNDFVKYVDMQSIEILDKCLQDLHMMNNLVCKVAPEMIAMIESLTNVLTSYKEKSVSEQELLVLGALAQKICNMSEKICLTYMHSEDTYTDYIVENYFKTRNLRNALIIYIVYPFVIQSNNPGHTNQVEVMEMAKVISELGYNVDVINTRYEKEVDSSKYDLVIGYGRVFDAVTSKMKKEALKICYLTERSPYFSNVAELKRLRYFEERNGAFLSFERQSYNLLDLSALARVDAAVCIGNENTAATYDNMFKKLYNINASGFSSFQLPDLNKPNDCRKNFLWYGGAGPIHKGLDVCIEAFRQLPDLRLYIVGEPMAEFFEFYRNDIENAENIFYYGFLSKQSEEFHYVCEQCGFCISPSCSEGQSTSVLTTLFAGIIPVCTKETGLDVEKAGGFMIKDIAPDKLAGQIQKLSELDIEDVNKLQKSAYEYAASNHTIEHYKKSLRNILLDILKKNKKLDLKVQFLNGGLANQVFQYLFARYYELSHPGQIMYLDDSYFANNTVHNGYELEKVFGLKPHMLSDCFTKDEWESIKKERREGKSIATIINEKYGHMVMVTEVDSYASFNPFEGEVMPIPGNNYFPEILDVPYNVYYHGYWINKNWFRKYENVFRQELKFPEIAKDDANAKYMDMIHNTNSVSLHVRRGDYVTIGIALDAVDWFHMCEEYLKKYSGDWTVFVFSDDIEWCKENEEKIGLKLFSDIVYIEGNVKGNNFRDIQLMSECKGMIMSNSAFCYLAGLLRKSHEYILNLTKREL